MKIEDYNEYYIQGSDHYLIPKDVFMELFNEMESWKQDTNKYKEVIDKAIEYIKHYETIRGYYEYEECGYDEYNYEEDLKEELLDILKESGE